jgi:hypothetical protein
MERKEAIERGFRKYETNRPCRNGHTAARYTLTTMCVICARDNQRRMKRKIQDNKIIRWQGYVEITVKVRKEDEHVVREFVESINWARNLGI